MKTVLPVLAAAFVATGALVGPAAAEKPIDRVCVVADPSGTPLNIRDEPNGRIIDTIRNGKWVYAETEQRHNGKIWVYVYESDSKGNAGLQLGWVFYEYLNCR